MSFNLTPVQRAAADADLQHETSRMAECMYRTEGRTCALVDMELRFTTPLVIETCDECWAAGPLDKGREVRTKFTTLTIGALKERLEFQPRKILIPLTVFHIPPEERDEAKIKAGLARSMGWYNARPSWGKAAALLKSVASITLSKVSPEVKATRERSCFGDASRPGCVFVKRGKQFSYCGACGCGEKELARLDKPEGGWTKLDFPFLECPLKRPGFSNASE